MLSVCAYGGVVGYFFCVLSFCVSFFLYCDYVRLGVVYQVFKFLDFVSDAVYVDLKYDDVCILWLIVVCEWLGGDLSAMGCCVVCLVLLLRCVWVCVWCISSEVCIVAIQMNPVSVVTSD